MWFSFLGRGTGIGRLLYKDLEMGRKRSEQITIEPGTTSKSKRKRLSCWEMSESVEEREGENAS